MRVLAPVAALLATVTFLLAGNGLQGTLLPIRAGLEGFSPFAVGVLGSAYFAGFVAGCLWTPRLVQRVGHIRAFTGLLAAASVMPLVHAMIVTPGPWWVLRGLTGFCLAGSYMVVESWLNERATNETRGTIFTAYTTINFSAITVGQMLLVTAPAESFALFSVVSILISLAAVPLALTRTMQPAPLATVRVRPWRLMAVSPVGAAACIAVGLANGAFWSLAPNFALGAGLGEDETAIFMSVTVIGGALSQYPFGRLSDRMDRRRVMILLSLLSVGAGAALYAASLVAPKAILVAGFLFGAFAFPLYAVGVAHVNDMIRGEGFVETASGLLLLSGGASVIGPLIASGMMAGLGAPTLFLFTAIVHLAMAGFAWQRMQVRQAPPEDQAAPFQAQPPMDITPPAQVLDPRAPDEPEPQKAA